MQTFNRLYSVTRYYLIVINYGKTNKARHYNVNNYYITLAGITFNLIFNKEKLCTILICTLRTKTQIPFFKVWQLRPSSQTALT